MTATDPAAAIAANRFGLGARPGELSAAAGDPRGWLEQQVQGERPVPPAAVNLPGSAQVFRTFLEVVQERRGARAAAARMQGEDGAPPRLAADGLRERIAPIYLDQVAARYTIAIRSPESFRERLVHFWTNHFAVSVDKPIVLGLAATLENEAVRPNLHRRFADLLDAVEAHPAMILYLDNQASVGPHSRFAEAARRRGTAGRRKLDINENLAREILELHTLGVAGGYTQQDVTTFAEVLTGWSVGGNGRGPLQAGETGAFVFRDGAHEPGARTLLGKRYGEDGIAQPRAVLADLARHPATARHIATKLARHFVSDAPPPAVVERLTNVFRETGGDLPSLHRALVAAPEAWDRQSTKFKTPEEFVVSAFRALDFVPPRPQQVLAPFQQLGQRPYAPGSPAGWPDTAEHWDGPDALLQRIEWSSALGYRFAARGAPPAIAAAALGPSLSERTRTAIARAASAAQGLTLWLASPEFMRR